MTRYMLIHMQCAKNYYYLIYKYHAYSIHFSNATFLKSFQVTIVIFVKILINLSTNIVLIQHTTLKNDQKCS